MLRQLSSRNEYQKDVSKSLMINFRKIISHLISFSICKNTESESLSISFSLT